MFGFNFLNFGEHGGGPSMPFKMQYSCFSVSMLPQERNAHQQILDEGGKIIMPPSALEQLTRLNVEYPMLFKLTDPVSNRSTHCGVLEFVADEGNIYMPYWMMQNLTLSEGAPILIESATLPVATYAKFQPQQTQFLELSNPKAVLESRLRNFACLTTGDTIAVQYNKKTYELSILETKPSTAVSVIECDLNVEFEAPVGYEDEMRSSCSQTTSSQQKSSQSSPSKALPKGVLDDDDMEEIDVSHMLPKPTTFIPFSGSGVRLDGRTSKKSKSTKSNTDQSTSSHMDVMEREYVRGIPDYEYKIGTLKFIRGKVKQLTKEERERDEDEKRKGKSPFEVFQGRGVKLRSGESK